LAENTQELVFAPWPYIAVYEIIEDQVLIRSDRQEPIIEGEVELGSLVDFEFDTRTCDGLEQLFAR
jgi:hypothetical protein